MPSRPVGVFDMGAGGLTVVKAIRAEIPLETVLFLGDEAGSVFAGETLDTEALLDSACRYAGFLLAHNAKALVVACNLMSATILDALQRRVPVPVIGVVEPGVRALEAAVSGESGEPVAVFTTPIAARVELFTRLLARRMPRARVYEVGCPELLSIIASGKEAAPEAAETVRGYAGWLGGVVPRAALLACTRFPVLLRAFEDALPGTRVIDPARETALALARCLKENSVRASARAGEDLLYTSGDTAQLRRLASLLLGGRLFTARRYDADSAAIAKNTLPGTA